MKKLIENIKGAVKKAIAVFAIASVCVMGGREAMAQGQTQPQVNSYQVNIFQLTNGVAEGTTVVLGGTTNLTTNSTVTITYNQSSGGFATNTNTVVFTNVVYPWINIPQQKTVALEWDFNCNVSDTSSKTLKLIYSLDGVYSNISSNPGDVISWIVPGQGTTRVVAITNLNNLGVGYLLPFSIQDGSATGGEFTTNHVLRYPTKKNAP